MMDMFATFLFCIVLICLIDTVLIIVEAYRDSKVDKLPEKELEDYTLNDCLVMYYAKKQCADIKDGKLLGFDDRRD